MAASVPTSMTLPALLQELTTAYEQRRQVQGSSSDALQFAADWFQQRLREERARYFGGSDNKPALPARRNAPGVMNLQNNATSGSGSAVPQHLLNAGAHPSPFSEHGPTDNPFASFGNDSLQQRRATLAATSFGQPPASHGQSSSQSPFGGASPFGASNQGPAGPGERIDFSRFSFDASNNPQNAPFGGQISGGPVTAPMDASPRDEAEDTLGNLGRGLASQGPPPAQSAGASALTADDLAIPAYALGRRTSVSAESLVPTAHPAPRLNGSLPVDDSETTPTAHNQNALPPKTEYQLQRIKQSIGHNFLFRNLDEEQEKDVLDAMREVSIRPGEIIIQQGHAGDYFYVVENGQFDIFVKKPAQADASAMAAHDMPPPEDQKPIETATNDAERESKWGKKVVTVCSGGSFGELALMYNAPRAATVIARTPGVLWALDRISFRTILLDHTSRKRRMYETFLSSVPILSSLEAHERAKIADALESRTFGPGEVVVQEGDQGDEFFLIESGVATFEKGGQILGEVSKGDYFGELALINRAPRAATVRAANVDGNKLRVAALGEQAFTRLLGPARDIMARTAGERYGSQPSLGH